MYSELEVCYSDGQDRDVLSGLIYILTAYGLSLLLTLVNWLKTNTLNSSVFVAYKISCSFSYN